MATDDLGVAEMYAAFPKLKTAPHQITSPFDQTYNCVAWALGDNTRRWWPSADDFWPPDFPAINDHVATFEAMLASFGFARCESQSVEAGFEKLAIFAYKGDVQHLARQLENGNWTSKLGKLPDIEHTLDSLTGGDYGAVVAVMKRSKTKPTTA